MTKKLNKPRIIKESKDEYGDKTFSLGSWKMTVWVSVTGTYVIDFRSPYLNGNFAKSFSTEEEAIKVAKRFLKRFDV